MKLPVFLVIASTVAGLVAGSLPENPNSLSRKEQANACFLKALALDNRDWKDAAYIGYSAAIWLDPSHASAHNNRANILFDRKQIAEAICEYRIANELRPSEYTCFNLGLAWEKAGDNQIAISYYTRALRMNWRYTDALEARAQLCMVKQPELALWDCNQAISINHGDPLFYRLRGDAKRNLGDRVGAIADYSEAIERFPPDYVAWTSRGRLRCQINNTSGAMRDLNEAIRLNPSHEWAYLCRAEAKAGSNDDKGEIADLDFAIQLDPNLGFAYSLRGNALSRLKEFSRAERDYQTAMRLEPTDAEIRTDYAIHLYRTKQVRRAIHETTAAIELDPKCSYAYLFRGMFKKKCDRNGALKDFDLAVKFGPTCRAPLLQRGLLKKLMGDKAGARLDLRQVLKLDPTLSEAKAALAKL
jgi:serine/threonine-protein kinase